MSGKEDMMSESGDDVDSVPDDFKTFKMLVPIIKGTLQEYSVSGTIRIGLKKIVMKDKYQELNIQDMVP
jgi:hypothetical protein